MDIVNVTIACPCPGTPHADGDTVGLRDRLSLTAGVQLQRILVEASASGPDAITATGILAEAYLIHGVAEWTLVDAEGKPLPLNPDTIRLYLCSDFSVAMPIADRADDLYKGPLVAPLVDRALQSSRTSPTTASTSPKAGGRAKAPRRLKPSLTTTTQTGVTVTTSP